jgi:hypothetical protein
MRLAKLEYGRVDEVSYWVDLALGEGVFPRDPSLSHVKWMKRLRVKTVIAQFVLVLKGKAKGGKIGVTRGCPITITLIRHLFIFRVDSLGETSPVTWGLEKAKIEVSIKDVPSHKSH